MMKPGGILMKYNPEMERVHTAPIAEELAARPEVFVSREEGVYFQKISAVCDRVTERHIHILLITGPSASGKTTTAKKIAHELRERGKVVNRISLDNFYKSSDELPRWEDGYQNYESVEGLDLDCFRETVQRLLQTGRAQFPIFDFTAGRRSEKTFEISYDEHTYLIIEGIHALNPLLTDTLAPHRTVKLYISVHSDFVDDGGRILLGARDLRLTRRLLRDFYYRGTGAEETLRMWDYVLRGEDLYIRPFREFADAHINSTHDYEPFLYHDTLAEMLRQTDPDSPYRETIGRLTDSARHFFGIDQALVPATSLIQEFIKRD
ncbi:hypothetical protein D4A47_07460 [Anaerotruncus massiliensis (ex Liu et al. 2021)]|uniref:Phosphoribulokinase/uridine kinase domain-containing protein n=2 Tax=Anaerotruncus TaxID=244127 RepID=A0A498CYW2_9FIRM|nr:hypothetical protein D4A47_07460 [Anaerotruncus massiliensis (ex Liu et al. 2021)]